MRNYFYLLFFLVIACKPANAQQFLNGSLEPTDNTLIKCNNVPKSIYDVKMGHSALTDSNGAAIFIGYKDTCDNTDNGLWYAGLIYLSSGANTPLGDRISLELDKPMIIGKKYKFSFAIKASNANFACSVFFGTMNNSIGTTRGIIDSVAAPTDTHSWLTVTDSFVAVYNDQYMFFEAGTPTTPSDGLTFVDHFRILNPLEGLSSINIPDLNVSAYPNPFSGRTTINIGEQAVLPCQLIITDMLGQTVQQRSITEQKTNLDLSNLPKGTYFLAVRDKENNSTHLKLITQ